MKSLLLLIIAFGFISCTGKDTVVRPHEQKLSEKDDFKLEVRRDSHQISKLEYEQLWALKGKPTEIFDRILKPLEENKINSVFISNPENIRGDFASTLNFYSEALLLALKENPSKEVLTSLNKFVDMSLKNCDENLNGCSAVKIFRLSGNSSEILVFKANLVGKQIDQCIQANKSCEHLVLEKYRLLGQANNLDSSSYVNVWYMISYMEHADLVTKLPATSIFRRNHATTFGTIVQFFDPNKTAASVRCKIIKNFDVWEYSRLSLGSSRQSIHKLFQMASACDLYDGSKKLSHTFKQVIKKMQGLGSTTENGSFFKIFEKIKNTPDQRELFLKYLPESLLAQATTIDVNGDINYSFYNEYFYVLDRMFNGHIGIEEAPSILFAANRSYESLLKTFETYVKMQLIAGVIETKIYMLGLLSIDSETVGSDRIFANAIENSEFFAQTWRTKKDNFTALYGLLRSVFQTPGLVTKEQKESFEEVTKQIRHLPSTIKFIATYPAMMSLAHFLAQQEGEKKAKTWWGGEIKYSASTIYEELWKGREKPWFQFSDAEPLNKFYVIYAFDYAVRSDFVSVQRTENAETLSRDEKLKNYVKVLIQKYFKSERDALSNLFENNYRPSVESNSMTSRQKLLCNYELDPNVNEGPILASSLEELRVRLHSGIGIAGTSTLYAEPSKNFLNNSRDILIQLNDKTIPKLHVMKILLSVLKQNKLPEAVLLEAEAEFSKTEGLIKKIVSDFLRNIKYHNACLMRLQLVENLYQYLGYESEKKYLLATWTRMASLQRLEGQELKTAIQQMNNLSDVYQNDNQRKDDDISKIFFDRIVDKKTFRYSSFDVLMRLKNQLTLGEINKSINGDIQAVINKWKKQFPDVMSKSILLPRTWDIQTPTNLADSRLFNERTNDINIEWTPNRDDFVKQGLKVLHGENDSNFLKWFRGSNYNLDVWKTSVEVLTYLYTIQDQSLDTSLLVGESDLLRSMKNILYLADMNEIDIDLANDMGFNSKYSFDKNFKNVLVDGGLIETMHPYTFLYEVFKTKSSMNSAMLDMNPAQLSAQGTLLADAYLIALNLTNNDYRIYFDTHKNINSELVKEYTAATQRRLKKILDFSSALEKNKNLQDAKIIFKTEDEVGVQLGEMSRTPFLENLVHPEKIKDMNKFVNRFTQKSRNIFETEGLDKKGSK